MIVSFERKHCGDEPSENGKLHLLDCFGFLIHDFSSAADVSVFSK